MSFINFLESPFPLLILSNISSQLAVKSGDFKSFGTKSISCFPLEVGIISFPLFSITKELNNFSIISALVATVPSPPVSPKVFAEDLSTDINFWGFSMADNKVPSLNLAGGFVSPFLTLTLRTLNSSPSFNLGSSCSFISSSPSSSTSLS